MTDPMLPHPASRKILALGARTGERAGAAMAMALALLAALPAAAQEDDPAEYVRARAADAQGSAAIAAAGYARVLAAVPDDEVIALRAYRQALSAGDYSLASKAAAVLVRKGVAPPDTAVLAFAIALRSGDRQGAQAAIQRLDKGPLDFLAPVLGAWLAHDRGEDAVALLDRQGGSGLARRYVGRHRALLLIAARRFDEAMVSLVPLTMDEDRDESLRIDAAGLLAAAGERGKARMLLVGDRPEIQALRRHPLKERPDAAFGASRLFLGLAQDIGGEGMQPLSVLLTRSALLLDPTDDRARILLAEALSKSGADDLALSVLGEVSRKSPFARVAAAGRVAALRRAGRTPEALAAAKALAGDRHATGEDAQAYGDILADTAQYEAAAAAYGAGLDRRGGEEDWMLHYLQGTALDRAGRWDEALSALRRAVVLAPMQPQALEYLGYAQVERGENLTDAEALLVRAQALKPNDPGIADSLGWAYFQQGDLTRALPLLEKAARADPGGPRANEHLGDAYWRLGRHYEARYAWRAATVYADAAAATRIAVKLDRGLVAKD